MIAFPAGTKVWIAGGVTDMRRGINTLALTVQQGLGRDPHAGEIFCFRGRKGDLVKLLWHDGVGMSLYLKRLEAGKFIWPVSQELKLEIAKLRRDKYGITSEHRTRLIDQLELQLEELEAAATEDALAVEQAADKASTVRAFTRRKPVRIPFPAHLPRERVVVEAPTSCTCCGSDRIVKMGEDIKETLEAIPRQWKVIQTVREKFTCRACEKVSQPPAPFHAIPRGWAGPQLIAMIAFEKYGQHQPLNRQSERIAREGIDLSLSTLADLIGHTCVALTPHSCVDRAPRAGCWPFAW